MRRTPTRLLGPISLALGLATILVSARLNPWFSLTTHAFSDLGGPKAYWPWVFNGGLTISGLTFAAYGALLTKRAPTKGEALASASTAYTGLFLTLIGLLPEGNKSHFFVSAWFFAQAWASMVAWGLALRNQKEYKGVSRTLLVGGSLAPLGLLAPWPSVALLEAYALAFIAIWVGALSACYPPKG